MSPLRPLMQRHPRGPASAGRPPAATTTSRAPLASLPLLVGMLLLLLAGPSALTAAGSLPASSNSDASSALWLDDDASASGTTFTATAAAAAAARTEASMLRGAAGRTLLQQRKVAPPPPSPPPPARPLAATFETHPVKAPIITIALTQVPSAGPRSRKYFAYWRAHNYTTDTSAATFDLDKRQVTLLSTKWDQFCNGPIVMPDGHTIMFGGHQAGNLKQVDGRRAISVYSERRQSMFRLGNLTYARWYPTPVHTADNKVLVVGGTPIPDRGPKVPVAELWDPSKPRNPTVQVPLPPAFAAASWYNWYPFMALLPRGEMLWWGDRGGSITDKNWKQIYRFPSLPRSFPYRTMYWFTSSIVLNALKPDPRTGEYNAFSMTIFGGALSTAGPSTPASPLSARIDMYYCRTGICDRGWLIESMAGQRRVMPTTTVLPNGKVYIHGGAQAGVAGWKQGGDGYQATLPAYQDLVYDPDAPRGSRFSLSANLSIIHMYHSASCLDLSGKVMSSGCETCGMAGVKAGPLPASVRRSPDGDFDYRISFAVPYEISKAVTRPVIVTAPTTIKRGSTFAVTFKYRGPITGATLAAPCANTHSINMNQRVLFLNVTSAARGAANIRAPPLSQPAAAPAGYYQLFLLGANTTAGGRTYSTGVWVKLTN